MRVRLVFRHILHVLTWQVRLVWTNAIYYNGKASDVGKIASEFSQDFEQAWRKEFMADGNLGLVD